MIVRRVATVVVAVALVVGAFLIRRNVIEGGDDDDGGDTTDGPEPAAELVCLTELEDICAALADARPGLAITIEQARETLDRVAEGEAVPLWLTFQPFPAMGSLEAGEVLAASELVMGTRAPRQAELSARCADQALWRCVGDLTGGAWNEAPPGQVEPSVGDAATSAGGLASFASAVAGYFDTAQPNRAEWESDPEFLGWVRGLVRAVPLTALTAGTPLATLLVRESAVSVAATSDAEITALGEPGTEVERSYPEPSMWLQAVLAAPAGAGVPEDLAADAGAALLAAGWERPDPAQTALPSANTMLALRQLWEDVQ